MSMDLGTMASGITTRLGRFVRLGATAERAAPLDELADDTLSWWPPPRTWLETSCAPSATPMSCTSPPTARLPQTGGARTRP
ncbi:hypothetical protein ACFQX6_44125 [Streptosporangium lutulentum]